MRILVAGRSGQVARALAEAAHDDGTRVIARGRPDLDLADRSSIERALEDTTPELVINAAAYTAVDRAEAEEGAANETNAAGPGRLAELAAARAIPLIHLSTD